MEEVGSDVERLLLPEVRKVGRGVAGADLERAELISVFAVVMLTDGVRFPRWNNG